MRFDLTDLRLFVHVAEALTITGGAERAGMALAAASARLRGMEAMLGAALLVRGRRGVGLTPAGRALERHARIVVRQVEQMRGELREYARGLKGQVRLLANTAAVAEFLPGPLAGFLRDNPEIDVELSERPSQAIADALASGRADAGIAADSVDLAGLETHPFALDQLVAVGHPDHPALTTRRPVAFVDLLDEDFVGLGAGAALQAHLAQHAASAGRTLRLRVRVGGLDVACRLAAAGVGIAIVPERSAMRARRTARMRVARLRDPWALRRLTICTRRHDALPAHARRMVDHLCAAATHAT